MVTCSIPIVRNSSKRKLPLIQQYNKGELVCKFVLWSAALPPFMDPTRFALWIDYVSQQFPKHLCLKKHEAC